MHFWSGQGAPPVKAAYPVVKLVLGQPSLHERGLERVEYLLALGLRRDRAAVASHAGNLVFGLDHLGASP
jgi:hypothetical protein